MGERPTILLADDEEAITAELQPFLERSNASADGRQRNRRVVIGVARR